QTNYPTGLGRVDANGNGIPFPNPPKDPGPDDNYLVFFPQQNATWSDVALVHTDISNTNNGSQSPVIYAALGTASRPTPTLVNNRVYWCENPYSNAPIWYVGDPQNNTVFNNPAVQPTAVDQRLGGFPIGQFPNQSQGAFALNGNIKISAVSGPTLVSTT